MAVPSRPVMRYHGGKWRLAPWIISHFPDHKIYVEPFGGAASVLLRKPRSYGEVYNDVNGDVVNLFRVLRDKTRAEELIKQIKLTLWSREEFEQAYEEADDPVERARRLLVRSWMGRTGGVNMDHTTGFRGHGFRRGSTPAMDFATLPPALKEIVGRLQTVIVEQRDAVALIEHQDRPETLHYLDPPYVHSSRESPNVYTNEYTEDDHRELAECVHNVDGMIVLSGYRCQLYDELYGSWSRYDREAVTSASEGGAHKTESLWLNPAAERRTTQTLFDANGTQ